MKKLFLPILVFGFLGCKTPCNDPSAPPAKIASAIASSWGCQDPAQVSADVEAWFASKNLCTPPQANLKQGIIANMFCPVAVAGLRDIFASRVPASWQCDPSKIGANAASALTGICELIPF